jgi:hypothetical protein
MTEDFALNGRVNSSGWSIVLCLTVRFVFTAEDFFCENVSKCEGIFSKTGFSKWKKDF